MRRSTPRWRWSTSGSKRTARRRPRLKPRDSEQPHLGPDPGPAAVSPTAYAIRRLGDLDVLPEAESVLDLQHFRPRRLIGPGGAGMALALDHDVVELHAVRTLEVVSGFVGLFQPIHAHGAAGKILIALAIDDVVALGDNSAFDNRLHTGLRSMLVLGRP